MAYVLALMECTCSIISPIAKNSRHTGIAERNSQKPSENDAINASASRMAEKILQIKATVLFPISISSLTVPQMTGQSYSAISEVQ